MADAKADRPAERAQGNETLARGRENARSELQRWNPQSTWSSPFELMDRMSTEMDRAFNRMFREFGMPRMQSWGSELPRGWGGKQMWSPRIEAFQKGDRFTVRAELPGMKKEDVQVELTNEALTIEGERKQEHQEEREGVYHSECEYGQFYRTIPLPEGVIGESAQATFRDGVLEVSMQAAPTEANRGRRLEITEPKSQTK